VVKVRNFCMAAADTGWNIHLEELQGCDHFIADDVFRRDDIQQWLAGG
jgi:hypothetical protein